MSIFQPARASRKVGKQIEESLEDGKSEDGNAQMAKGYLNGVK